MTESGGKTDIYQKGDRVYAQLLGFPPWPAQVQKRSAGRLEQYCVYFYGTYDWACLKPRAMFPYTPENTAKFGKPTADTSFNKAMEEIKANLDLSGIETIPCKQPSLVKQPAKRLSGTAKQDSMITPSGVSLLLPIIELQPSIATGTAQPKPASKNKIDETKIPAEHFHDDKIGSLLSVPVRAPLSCAVSFAESESRLDLLDSPTAAKRAKKESNEVGFSTLLTTAVPLNSALGDPNVNSKPTNGPDSLPKSTKKPERRFLAKTLAISSISSSKKTNTAVVRLVRVSQSAAPPVNIPRAIDGPAPSPIPQVDSERNTCHVTDGSSVMSFKSEAAVCDKQFLENLYLFTQQNPDRCDVTFEVGPDNVRIKSWKSILVTASPELRRLFEEKWDLAVSRKIEGIIPLPDFDPETFKIFLKILPLPAAYFTLEFFKELNLTGSQMFELIKICTTFHMNTMRRLLEKNYNTLLVHNFEVFVERPEFLNISSQILKTMLSLDNIPMKEIEIFKCAYKWAKHQCIKRSIEETPENLRMVLGDVIREIRFPLISIMDFGSIVFPTKILTDEENSNIFKSIALVEAGSLSFDKSELGFKVMPRTSKWSSLRLVEDSEVVSSPPFVCDGSKIVYNMFRVRTKFEAVGLGFLGPVDSDEVYAVEVDPKKWVSNIKMWKSCGAMKKNIPAKRNQVFYFMFDEPIVILPLEEKNYWNLRIDFSMKGKSSQSTTKSGEFSTAQDGIKFDCKLVKSQLVELLFRKV